MLEIMKLVVNAMLINQGTNVGLKVINQKTVTDEEVGGLIIAVLAVAILDSNSK